MAALRLDPPGAWERTQELWVLARAHPVLAVAVAVAAAATVVVVATIALRSGAPPVEDTLPMATSPGSPAARRTHRAPRPPRPRGRAVCWCTPRVRWSRRASTSSPRGAGRRPGGRGGGLAPGADADRVNLAAELVDGGRVWVPRVGEEHPPAVVGAPAPAAGPDGRGGDGPGGEPTGDPASEGADDLVDVNRAGPDELEELPGIGPVTAEAIVSHREEHGPFRAVDDLLDVSGIGDAKLDQLRDRVRI
ncbi:MAG: ComEA family DNA-binding protein [Acidimicrobiia bacterium]|nr:ComEA family DNA-binding protein [Acidimicrobiia bacterium]